MSSSTEEFEWIQRSKQGDSRAQMKLYDRYSERAYQTAVRLVPNVWDAEEQMHEAFLRAFRQMDAFESRASFYTWFHRILVRTCLDHLRVQRISWTSWDESMEVAETSEAALPQAAVKEQVLEAIRALPDGYRVIVSLYLLEGYDHEEIAGILGISASTSRSQYTRARQKLREYLRHEGSYSV